MPADNVFRSRIWNGRSAIATLTACTPHANAAVNRPVMGVHSRESPIWAMIRPSAQANVDGQIGLEAPSPSMLRRHAPNNTPKGASATMTVATRPASNAAAAVNVQFIHRLKSVRLAANPTATSAATPADSMTTKSEQRRAMRPRPMPPATAAHCPCQSVALTGNTSPSSRLTSTTLRPSAAATTYTSLKRQRRNLADVSTVPSLTCRACIIATTPATPAGHHTPQTGAKRHT